jgi:hypothetical protein
VADSGIYKSGATAEIFHQIEGTAEEQNMKITKRTRALRDEQDRLLNMDVVAKKLVKEAAEIGDFESSAVQKKIADAKLRSDMVSMRLPKIEAELKQLERDLAHAFKSRTEDYNEKVADARAALVEKIVQANLPFWDGDERGCRRHFDGETLERLPIFHHYRRAVYPGSGFEQIERSMEHFLSWVRRYGAAIGLTPDLASEEL